MARTISNDDADTLSYNGVDPDNIASSYDDSDLSPLTAASASLPNKKSSGSSPLQAFSNKLLDKAEAMSPQRDDVMAKRAALMDSFKTLMNAQAYQGSAVRDPQAVAVASDLLQSGPGNIAQGLGKSFADQAAVSQALADRKQAAALAQAGTGNAAAGTDLGFLNSDQTNSMDLLKQAATTENKNETLLLRQQLAQMGRDHIVKDSQGNPIGIMNDRTGKVDPLPGQGGTATGTTPGGAPLINIPGVTPNSPVHAGLSQIIADTGVDPASLTARSRSDIAAATKDAESARDILNSANKAAVTAKQAEVHFANGTPGLMDKLESNINYVTGKNIQGGTDYDLIEKYNKDIASALANSMKNARIGIGMDKFLSGTTFSTGMSADAAKQIINKTKDMPFLAQRNMDLENLTNKLPIAAKNAVFSEFLNDNPPYINDEKAGQIINPTYKDKNLVQNWLKQRGTPASTDSGAGDAGTVFTPDQVQAEVARRAALKAGQ